MKVYVVRNKYSKRGAKNYCYLVVANTKSEALNLFWEKELMKTQDVLFKKDFDVITIKTTSLKAFDVWNDEEGD